MALHLQPINIGEARVYVDRHHRHHRAPLSALFAIGVNDGEEVVGVILVGRPVARMNDDGFTAEVTRCCTDGSRNACSMLYGAAWRAARALGYRRLITYILDNEPGTSLTAAGFKLIGKAGGGSWSTKSRPRVDKHPLQGKLRFELNLDQQRN